MVGGSNPLPSPRLEGGWILPQQQHHKGSNEAQVAATSLCCWELEIVLQGSQGCDVTERLHHLLESG
jgi:hypothetical protein